jgi:hypothetical protein
VDALAGLGVGVVATWIVNKWVSGEEKA